MLTAEPSTYDMIQMRELYCKKVNILMIYIQMSVYCMHCILYSLCMQAGSVQTMQALWYKVQCSISLIHRDNNPGLHLDQLPGLLYKASLLSKVSCNMAICFNGPDSLVKQFTIVQCVLSCILVIIGTFKLLSASMLSTFSL